MLSSKRELIFTCTAAVILDLCVIAGLVYLIQTRALNPFILLTAVFQFVLGVVLLMSTIMRL